MQKNNLELEEILLIRFKEFYKDPTRRQKKIPIDYREFRLKITYIYNFPFELNKDENDSQGYIYYKPLWAISGQLYMFKSLNSPPKKKFIWDVFTFFFFSKTSKGKAEIQIVCTSLISILPIIIPLLIIVIILVKPTSKTIETEDNELPEIPHSTVEV
ncbi:hypothetical protein AN641_05360 [Candidatus Epulonipiscioides gigas]|nr:hypothetical protein AN641_05360 [Epulopiscium sp. SCG-C07WGA-EpuloA2]